MEVGLKGLKLAVNGLDGSLAAKPTTGRSEDMACQAGQIDGDTLGQEDIQGVAMGIARVGTDHLDLIPGLDDSLRQQKTGGQFLVVARGTHGDADGAGFHLDFQGFLGGHGVDGGLEVRAG